MSSYRLSIFIAPPEVAKVTGRYICLLRGNTDSENRYLAEDSLVELARAVDDETIDWTYVENALLQKGIFEH